MWSETEELSSNNHKKTLRPSIDTKLEGLIALNHPLKAFKWHSRAIYCPCRTLLQMGQDT